MPAGWAAVVQIVVLVLALAAVHRPLGDYLARMFSDRHHLRLERLVYRAVGVDPETEQRWPVYARSVLAFSVLGVLLLYALQRVQQTLPWDRGMPGVAPATAWDTAVSFVTNTNWQSYSGESTMGHFVQMAGLTVQNFLSGAVGLSVAIALVRGFARSRTDRLGNFWVDCRRDSRGAFRGRAGQGALRAACSGRGSAGVGALRAVHCADSHERRGPQDG